MTYLRLANSIESKLRHYMHLRSAENGITQADIAEKLGVDRSAITRRLTGRTNMTIETIADMLWALDCQGEMEVFDCVALEKSNRIIRPAPDAIQFTVGAEPLASPPAFTIRSQGTFMLTKEAERVD